MATYLITGRSGSGKSAIYRELAKRGLRAFDGDKVPGLASWTDLQTGKTNQPFPGPIIDRDRFHWNWDEHLLAELLSQNNDLFLCGSADNQLEFHHLFDKVFVLTLQPENQRARILERTEHNYGKELAMQNIVLAEQKLFVEQALQLGAIPIYNDGTLETTVTAISKKCSPI